MINITPITKARVVLCSGILFFLFFPPLLLLYGSSFSFLRYYPIESEPFFYGSRAPIVAFVIFIIGILMLAYAMYLLSMLHKRILPILIFTILISFLFASIVILASLNCSRCKSLDAVIKATLSGAKAQAEIFYEGHNNSYLGVCESNEGGQVSMVSYLSYVKRDSPEVVCNDSVTEWAASARLKYESMQYPAKYWCVDSTGASREIDESIQGTKCI